MLAHRSIMNFSSVNAAESTTILVRLEPDTVTLDIPFNRVTTWNRLIQTLFDIYMRNNPCSRHLTLEDALYSIKIRNDRTRGIILPELWPDFIKPQVKIAAEFQEPFLCPPWNPKYETEVKREEEDFEMMEGVVSYAIEPKLGGFIEPADWRKQANRLLAPPPSKGDDIGHIGLLPALTNIPAAPFTFTPPFTNSWAAMEHEKPRLRHHVNGRASPLSSDLFAETVLAHRSVSQEPTIDPMVERSVSPPPSIPFRNPFPQSNLSGSLPAAPAIFPQRFTPVRHIPASDANSRTPTQSPECTNRPAKDANPRPTKRKRDESDRIGSSPMESYMEPPRKSRSPFRCSDSNGSISRAHSVDTESAGQRGSHAISVPSPRANDNLSSRTIVLHSKVLLLDSINAGEMVKVIKTKDNDVIVIRDDEEPEEFMERRQSTASLVSLPGLKDRKEIGTAKTSKKRAHEEASTELVRIWSGCVEPPAKRTKAKAYDRLTVDQKIKISKFVKEQHIIRIDHFTNPVVQEWKTRIIPEADPKQTEEYIEEIASGVYSDNIKKKEAYRLFMEHHNHSHKSSDSRSNSKA
ncbi:hypothetical protein TWF730_001497 [Orbilia blumenaviensis]|uniref:Uncharacterized protein n=1 Tax=Orbilia blumenaviensis TaxID=1796055 RepID=A0AAV9UMB6_9PEZI